LYQKLIDGDLNINPLIQISKKSQSCNLSKIHEKSRNPISVNFYFFKYDNPVSP